MYNISMSKTIRFEWTLPCQTQQIHTQMQPYKPYIKSVLFDN